MNAPLGKIVCSYSLKGGVGKSTTLWNLAWRLHEYGKYRVLLLEGDSATESISTTFRTMSPDLKERAPRIGLYNPQLDEEVKFRLAPEYDFTFIDTKGGADDETSISALSIADLVISSIIPSPANKAPVANTIKGLRPYRLQNPNLQYRFVLVGVNETKRIARELIQDKNESPELFFQTIVHQAAALEQTIGEDFGGPLSAMRGETGFERANVEINQLCREVVHALVASPHADDRTLQQTALPTGC